VGDAFGERFFDPRLAARLAEGHHELPPGPWPWTDDTAMALGIVEVLREHGAIDPALLGRVFARNYRNEPDRGYGPMARKLLEAGAAGGSVPELAGEAFGGQGSMGNGAAMRVAPVGAFFADDPEAAAQNARRSATVTHPHPEGVAGAVAVAMAAVAAARGQTSELLAYVLARTPEGETARGLARATELPFATPVPEAAALLGNGSRVTCPDTVPFALWCAARHAGDYPASLWATVTGGGDRDTTCAIVGGVAALATGWEGIPPAWRQNREPLPAS
jgi:ADP-ribosylglycohydrolase